MAVDLDPLLTDLAAEQDQLAALLEDLGEADWDAPTPATGWSVRHQVAHLAQGEELAATAVADPDSFVSTLGALVADLDAVETALEVSASRRPESILHRWNTARAATISELVGLDPGARVLWVTGPMSAPSFTTARLMETWAHGHDMREGIGRGIVATDRLRHVAHLGVATLAFSFANRGLEPPRAPVRVRLAGPDGAEWTWGPADAADRVSGPALDFCRVVTRRRRAADAALEVVGPVARAWLEIAQCYAGPPSADP